jgi:adenosylcobinamide kinase/adenosylcobinamide-phosphate guanylyltransferase
VRILVTGGVRSGKSAHAETLLADATAVTVVATGVVPDGSDPEWTRRIDAHRARRSPHWQTIESADLVAAFSQSDPGSSILLDSVGTWLAARLDVLQAWDQPPPTWEPALGAEIDRTLAALPADIVMVTDEVGLGGVGSHPSARLYADLLGDVNQRFAAACDQVHLVVAGRHLVIHS